MSTQGSQLLTYAYLASLAVPPGERGAYRDSPLNSTVGLHTHDGENAVHFIENGDKIAVIGPDSLEVLVSGTYASEPQRGWVTRLRAASQEPDPAAS